MRDDIKKEFKEFINALSTEICKEVLLEELEKINSDLNTTSDKYSNLYLNYNESINKIKEELVTLDNATKQMKCYTSSIDLNTNKINEALELITEKQQDGLNDIIRNNSSMLSDYSIEVQKLNESERDVFINTVNSSLDKYSKKYLKELEKVISGQKL